ncbi:MAG: RIP metalloprotease RseP [Vicinamibacteria bacterium]
MTTLLAFLFVLGVLVFFHEAGHFLTAKRVGVRVNVFSLGFPPKLIARKWGETEYRVGLLPLGGYVKMAGDNPAESSGDPAEFLSRSRWERLAILFAGPLANFVLAVLILTGLFMVGVERPAGLDDPPVVRFLAEGSPAALAGIKPGDRIVEIAGAPVETWTEVLDRVVVSAGETLSLVVIRDERRVETRLEVAIREEDGAGYAGIFPAVQPQVGRLTPGFPAEQAGMRVGDVITKVNGKPIFHFAELIQAIEASAGSEIALQVLRGQETVDFRLTPRRDQDRWLIGIEFNRSVLQQYSNPIRALGAALEETGRFTRLTFVVLGKLVTGQASVRQMSGPIGIAQASGETARQGFKELFTFMAFLSLNLAILNLLPIPLLDGGHMAIIALEGLAGRDFSLQMKERILQVGFVMLLLLMVTVIYVDLSKIEAIGKFLPW